MSQSLARVTTDEVPSDRPAHPPPAAVPDARPSGSAIAGHRLHCEADVVRSLERMGSQAVNEILSTFPAAGDPTAIARRLAAQRDEDLKPAERGVESLLICEAPLLDDARIRAELELRAAEGIRVRTLERLTQWVALFDRRIAVLPANPARSSQETIVVRERAMVSSLHALYVGLWHRSVDLGRHRKRDHGRPSRDRQVLSLMTSGATDETAARDMDVSVRTYRRYVADLMTALGASSRFQAGVLASTRGWT